MSKTNASKKIKSTFTAKQPGYLNIAGETFFLLNDDEDKTIFSVKLYDDSVKGDAAFNKLYMDPSFTEDDKTKLRKIYMSVFGSTNYRSFPCVDKKPDENSKTLLVKSLNYRRKQLIQQIHSYDFLHSSDLHARYIREHLLKLNKLIDTEVESIAQCKTSEVSSISNLTDERMRKLLNVFAFLLAQGKNPLNAFPSSSSSPLVLMEKEGAKTLDEYEREYEKEHTKKPEYTEILQKIRGILLGQGQEPVQGQGQEPSQGQEPVQGQEPSQRATNMGAGVGALIQPPTEDFLRTIEQKLGIIDISGTSIFDRKERVLTKLETIHKQILEEESLQTKLIDLTKKRNFQSEKDTKKITTLTASLTQVTQELAKYINEKEALRKVVPNLTVQRLTQLLETETTFQSYKQLFDNLNEFLKANGSTELSLNDLKNPTILTDRLKETTEQSAPIMNLCLLNMFFKIMMNSYMSVEENISIETFKKIETFIPDIQSNCVDLFFWCINAVLRETSTRIGTIIQVTGKNAEQYKTIFTELTALLTSNETPQFNEENRKVASFILNKINKGRKLYDTYLLKENNTIEIQYLLTAQGDTNKGRLDISTLFLLVLTYVQQTLDKNKTILQEAECLPIPA